MPSDPRESGTSPKQARPRRAGLDIATLAMAALLMLWGASGFVNDKLVTGKGSSKVGFQGAPAWLMASAAVCGAILLLIAALPSHARTTAWAVAVRWVLVRLSWCLLTAAVVSQVYVGFTH